MTFIVPALLVGGFILAVIGKTKSQTPTVTQAPTNDAFDGSTPIAIPPVTSGGVGDPTSPASRMSSGSSKSANAQAPISRGQPPPQAPMQVSPVPTAQAPKLGTANKVIGLRLGMR